MLVSTVVPAGMLPLFPIYQRQTQDDNYQTYVLKDVGMKREQIIVSENRNLTRSDLSAQKRRVWWRFCTTM